MDNETHSFEFGKTQNEDAANNDKGEDLQKKKKKQPGFTNHAPNHIV